MPQGKSSGLLETMRTIVYAILIALVVRTVAFEPFNIPSGSMVPTLLKGDYLFVAKYSYGYSRYSLPFGMPLIPGRILFDPPERGDVAVFKLPRDNSTDYIKRIVGLPGDRIQVREGVLYINDEEVKRERIDDYVEAGVYGNPRRTAQYIETLSNGRSYRVLDRGPGGQHDNTPVYVVPEGHFFAMGDNRDNSLDSRVPGTRNGVGFVPAENLVGRAEVIFFSTDGSARFWEVWKWPAATRFARFFRGIV
ncbi:MAG: signal peptidase I [Alphaproteobacteria bacterium]